MQPEEKNPTKKIIIIAASALIVLAALYFFVFRKSPPPVSFDQFGNPIEAQAVGQDLVDLLNQLQNVKLDDSIFRKQAFINLTDYSVTLPNLPRGRNNPFDPIGVR